VSDAGSRSAPGALTCFLVRHGAAAPGADDRERPLTAGGAREVAMVAQALARRRVAVEEIRHSGLRRARETAEILADALRPAGGVCAVTGLAPDDDPAVAAAELALAAGPVMLVGHLPHLDRLLATLVGPAAAGIQFSPGTVVGAVREGASWRVGLRLVPAGGGAAGTSRGEGAEGAPV
jgi:phosphohistidine phosphatase